MIRTLTALTAGLLLCVNAFAQDKEDAKKALKELKGTWVIATAERSGEAFEQAVGDTIKFDGKNVVVTVGGRENKGTVELDTSKKPMSIDFISAENPDEVMRGIYKIEKGKMTLCVSGESRPEKFDSSAGRTILFELKRKED